MELKIKIIMDNCKEMVVELSTEYQIDEFREFIKGKGDKYLDVRTEGWDKTTYIFLEHIAMIIEL